MEDRLNLLSNSISFFREAIRYAEVAQDDPSKWKFAIINLVQAMELALKEALQRIHPAFIYEDIDRPDTGKTISVSKAIFRLNSEHIGKSSITDSEIEHFQSAIKIRNRFVHFDGAYQAEHVEAKFASIFAFMLFFYEDHLDLTREDVISVSQYAAIFSLKKAREELLAKVSEQLAVQNIEPIWLCPDCLEDTFVVEEGSCRLCGFAEKVLQCQNCAQDIFERDSRDISTLFDSDFSEGRLHIFDSYGYDTYACVNCVDDVREDIKNKKFEKFVQEMEEEENYVRRG